MTWLICIVRLTNTFFFFNVSMQLANYHSKLYILNMLKHNYESPLTYKLTKSKKKMGETQMWNPLTSLRVSITSVIRQPQSDRENADGLQIFARNALEFTWCNQSKLELLNVIYKIQEISVANEMAKVLTVNFQWRLSKKNCLLIFFLATWVNIAALLFVKEAIDRGFCLQ